MVIMSLGGVEMINIEIVRFIANFKKIEDEKDTRCRYNRNYSLNLSH